VNNIKIIFNLKIKIHIIIIMDQLFEFSKMKPGPKTRYTDNERREKKIEQNRIYYYKNRCKILADNKLKRAKIASI